ncbi:MAG TPA: hypothetical protein VKZ53_15515 [Candidatus Angelobacter sp.]|nr:hypothetical protein [Candidatus Angelobacter sp.]
MKIGISCIEYALPSRSVSLQNLQKDRRLSSSAEQLQAIGSTGVTSAIFLPKHWRFRRQPCFVSTTQLMEKALTS